MPNCMFLNTLSHNNRVKLFFFLTTQYQTKILSVPPEHRFRYGICVAAAAGAAVPAAGKR